MLRPLLPFLRDPMSAFDFALERLSVFTIDSDVVIRSITLPRAVRSQRSLAEDRLVHRAGRKLLSLALD